MTKYGIPYKGSKNIIAGKLVANIPVTDNFVDIMCGGMAMSHAMKEIRSETKVHANDNDRLLADFHGLLQRGEWTPPDHFVTRREFFERKDRDIDIAIIYSFGNDRGSYMYSYEREPKIAAISDVLIRGGLPESYERFLKSDTRAYCGVDVAYIRDVQRICAIIRFQRKMMGKVSSIQCGSYFDYKFDESMNPDNTVVYCDPPYIGTSFRQYKEGRFHHERFYWWLRNSRFLCIVSEFSMPSDFVCVFECERNVITEGKGASRKSTERLFVHESKVNMYMEMMERSR